MSLFKKMLAAMTGGADRIAVDEGKQRVVSGAMILDVRSPGEFASGHLAEAVNLPVGELARRIEELPKDRGLVLYCASGIRSRRAAEFLREAGFTVGDLGPMPSAEEWNG